MTIDAFHRPALNAATTASSLSATGCALPQKAIRPEVRKP